MSYLKILHVNIKCAYANSHDFTIQTKPHVSIKYIVI